MADVKDARDAPSAGEMRSGGTLLQRLHAPLRPARTALQWLALAIIVLPVFVNHAVLWLLATVLFCLLWRGVRATRVHADWAFNSIPRLTAESTSMYERETWEGVTVLSPARNEEDGIERALRSLAALDYPNLQIIAIDDHSTDATPRIIDDIARDHPRIRVIHDPPLQEGWTGKSNGIWFALHEYDITTPWLLFTDADVVFHPQALRVTVEFAEEEGLDFLTCLPLLETDTIWEELVLPPTWRRMVGAVPYNKLNHRNAQPVGIGAFMLVRREQYFACGGHAVYPDQQLEDVVLAGLIKESGGKVGVAWTPDLLHIRLYRGLRHLLHTSTRIARIVGDDTLLYPLHTLSSLVLPSVLPLPLALIAVLRMIMTPTFAPWPLPYALIALATYYEYVRVYQAAQVVSRMRPWLAWFHPVAGMVRGYISVRAFLDTLFGRQTAWRDRRNPFVKARNRQTTPQG